MRVKYISYIIYIELLLHKVVESSKKAALTFTNPNSIRDFLPPLYQSPTSSFTEEIYIQISTTPSDPFYTLYLPESYGIQITESQEVFMECNEGGFPHLYKCNRSISLGAWTLLSIVYESRELVIRVYINGQLTLYTPCVPGGVHREINTWDNRHYILQHLAHGHGVYGVIYFRNYRFWGSPLSATKILDLYKTGKIYQEENLLIYAPLTDGRIDTSYTVSLIDYSRYGMHMRGSKLNEWTDVESNQVPDYFPSLGALHPISQDVIFDISKVNIGTEYTLGFWVKYTTNANGAKIISGSLAATCSKDTIITLSAPTTRFYIQNKRFGVDGSNLHVNVNTCSWIYIYIYRDGALTGGCGAYNTGLGAIDTWDCNNNNYVYFCNQIIFYKSAADTYFKHFQLYVGRRTVNIRLFAYSKYLPIYILVIMGIITMNTKWSISLLMRAQRKNGRT